MLCKNFAKHRKATKCFAKTVQSTETRRNALEKLFKVYKRGEMLLENFSNNRNEEKYFTITFKSKETGHARFCHSRALYRDIFAQHRIRKCGSTFKDAKRKRASAQP